MGNVSNTAKASSAKRMVVEGGRTLRIRATATKAIKIAVRTSHPIALYKLELFVPRETPTIVAIAA